MSLSAIEKVCGHSGMFYFLSKPLFISFNIARADFSAASKTTLFLKSISADCLASVSMVNTFILGKIRYDARQRYQPGQPNFTKLYIFSAVVP